MFHIANLLTLYRIIISPLFIAIFLRGELWSMIVCLALVLSFLLTDYLDGYLARRYNAVSDSGKLLDPLADKISNFSVFLCFLVEGYAHVWMIAAIFYRDALVNLIRSFAAARHVIIGARLTGKLKTAFQGIAMVAVLLLIVWQYLDGTPELKKQILGWSNWVMGVTAVVTCLSLIDYIQANWRIIRGL